MFLSFLEWAARWLTHAIAVEAPAQLTMERVSNERKNIAISTTRISEQQHHSCAFCPPKTQCVSVVPNMCMVFRGLSFIYRVQLFGAGGQAGSRGHCDLSGRFNARSGVKQRCCRSRGSILVGVLFGNIILEHLVRLHFALVGFERVFHAANGFGLIGLTFLQQFLHTLRIHNLFS